MGGSGRTAGPECGASAHLSASGARLSSHPLASTLSSAVDGGHAQCRRWAHCHAAKTCGTRHPEPWGWEQGLEVSAPTEPRRTAALPLCSARLHVPHTRLLGSWPGRGGGYPSSSYRQLLLRPSKCGKPFEGMVFTRNDLCFLWSELPTSHST